MAGRRSRLHDDTLSKDIADLYVRGVGLEEMEDALGIPVSTLRVYIKDPRVQAHARQISAERVQRITRRLDGEIDQRLSHVDEWSLDEILKVRKEYLDRPLKVGQGDGVDLSRTTDELSEAMDQSPDLLGKLRELLESNDS